MHPLPDYLLTYQAKYFFKASGLLDRLRPAMSLQVCIVRWHFKRTNYMGVSFSKLRYLFINFFQIHINASRQKVGPATFYIGMMSCLRCWFDRYVKKRNENDRAANNRGDDRVELGGRDGNSATPQKCQESKHSAQVFIELYMPEVKLNCIVNIQVSFIFGSFVYSHKALLSFPQVEALDFLQGAQNFCPGGVSDAVAQVSQNHKFSWRLPLVCAVDVGRRHNGSTLEAATYSVEVLYV